MDSGANLYAVTRACQEGAESLLPSIYNFYNSRSNNTPIILWPLSTDCMFFLLEDDVYAINNLIKFFV